jgi:GTP-binding protein EngB required for normal cell division
MLQSRKNALSAQPINASLPATMSNSESNLKLFTSLAQEWKLANLQPQIAACREMLGRSNGIDVAVFGRFKAGKSSFLNHLTGRDVLPIGVVPLTAVITRLRYGERERAEVRFLDGVVKDIPLGDIGLYVGEKENPNNRKQVAAVEVELPELKPFAPLQFVDTPGLGSALAHNTEVALNWLPNVGAAVVAVSSDAPLSERDLALLEDLRRHTPKIALLLTKADLLTEAQRAEVREFVHQQWQMHA